MSKYCVCTAEKSYRQRINTILCPFGAIFVLQTMKNSKYMRLSVYNEWPLNGCTLVIEMHYYGIECVLSIVSTMVSVTTTNVCPLKFKLRVVFFFFHESAHIIGFVLNSLFAQFKLTDKSFSHLADAFIQSDLQMRTMEAIKTNKRATTCKCYDKSRLA